MEKYLVALGGVLGYFGLVFLYAVSAYLLVRSPFWVRLLFGFSSLSILCGMIAHALGWFSNARILFVESVLIVGAVCLTAVYFWLRKGKTSKALFAPSGSEKVGDPALPPLVGAGEEEMGEDEPEGNASVGKEIARCLSGGLSVLVYGPTGSGKTYGVVLECLRNAKVEGTISDIVLIPCSDGMEDYDLLNKPVPVGPKEKAVRLREMGGEYPGVTEASLSRLFGDWDRAEGPLRSAFRRASSGEKLAVVFDELNRSSKSAMNLILKAMDPVLGYYELVDFTSGQVFRVPLERLLFCATCNIGEGYGQTRELDWSLVDRFSSVVFMDYDIGLERHLLESEGVGSTVAEQMIRVAKALRAAYRTGDLSAPLSTRHLKNWGYLVAGGSDPETVARNLWINRLVSHDRHGFPDENQVRGILEILHATFGRQGT